MPCKDMLDSRAGERDIVALCSHEPNWFQTVKRSSVSESGADKMLAIGLSGLFRAIAFFFKKRPPRDAGRQISNVTADARKVGLSGIVDQTRKWFTRLQIFYGFNKKSAHLNDVRVSHAAMLFGSIHYRT